MNIREATRADVPLLLSLIRALAQYEKLEHQVVATPEQLAAALFAPDPVAHALIASHEGVAAGFALYFWNFSTFLARPGLYLEDLFVLPAMRGRGIGRQLLVELARRAGARDCGRMEWSVLDWNEPAIRFYESLGARRLEEWRTFRLTREGIDALAKGA
jgi:GNAT superfamily N-acetyltransferase